MNGRLRCCWVGRSGRKRGWRGCIVLSVNGIVLFVDGHQEGWSIRGPCDVGCGNRRLRRPRWHWIWSRRGKRQLCCDQGRVNLGLQSNPEVAVPKDCLAEQLTERIRRKKFSALRNDDSVESFTCKHNSVPSVHVLETQNADRCSGGQTRGL
jgi:hypothetical protein